MLCTVVLGFSAVMVRALRAGLCATDRALCSLPSQSESSRKGRALIKRWREVKSSARQKLTDSTIRFCASLLTLLLCIKVTMEESHDLMNQKPSFVNLSNQLNAGIADVRQITHRWVLDQGAEKEQLEGIRTIFDPACMYTEGLNEVVMEAWGMLVEGRLWRALFASRDEAVKALDTPLLKDIRARAQSSRNRKDGFINTIKKECSTTLHAWDADKHTQTNHRRRRVGRLSPSPKYDNYTTVFIINPNLNKIGEEIPTTGVRIDDLTVSRVIDKLKPVL